MGSCIISRLQVVVAREIDFKEPCVVTCGTFHGGTDVSIIPEYADFKVDTRPFNKDIQLTAVKAVKRIIEGECQAANSPQSPRILTAASCPPIDNVEEATARFTGALHSFYGDKAPERVFLMDLGIAADDFVLMGHSPGEKPIPYIYWNYGVTPREEYNKAEKEGTLRDLLFNNNPRFAPEIEPSLRGGIEELAIASVIFFVHGARLSKLSS